MSNPHAGLPRAFDLSRLAYFSDFVLVPPIAVALLVCSKLTGAASLLAVVCGLSLWSLLEYWIHRGIFHGTSRLAAMHDLHHAMPKDWIGVASWGSLAGFGAVWLVLWLAFGAGVGSAITSGLMLGYFVYCVLHVSMHHDGARGFGRYGALMLRLHRGHHRGGHGNFGVSSPLWDIVFRTYHPVN